MTTPRVVTLTFSPTIDVATSVDVVTPSHKLRCTSTREEPDTGGINVARVAQRLGDDAVAVTPTPVIIYTSGAALRAALQSGAALVKPSACELADLAERRLATDGDITTAAIDTGDNLVDAICLGIAASTAAVMSDGTELCEPHAVRDLLPLVVLDAPMSFHHRRFIPIGRGTADHRGRNCCLAFCDVPNCRFG
jgi:fructose-1-phosphate kinase PfkB-like protein